MSITSMNGISTMSDERGVNCVNNKHLQIVNILVELQDLIPDIIMDKCDYDILNNLCIEMNHIPRISLLGKSGDGKSSLINKLLKKPNLLDTFSKGGGAVTSCPYELFYGETARFEIEYEDLNTIDEDCKKDILISKDKMDELHFNIKWDENLGELIELLVKEKVSFNKKYPSDYINNKPLSKALSFYKKKHKLTTEGFSFKILPLIKNIKIYLPCDILNKVTLVDLPGLNDTCQYRIKRTEKYLDEHTNIIALIDDCQRITSDDFIDKTLNTYIINSIIRNNIKDILIVGTKSDQKFKEIKSQLRSGNSIDSDSADSDSDSDSDGAAAAGDGSDDDSDGADKEYNSGKIERIFNKNIMDITRSLKQKIMDNESLSIRNITNDDIHIVMTSSELRKSLSNIELLNSTICDIIKYRNIKLKSEFKKIISKLYRNFDDYINRPTKEIKEYTINLIEHEFEQLIKDIKLKYSILEDDMKITGPLFTLDTTKIIKKNLEPIKESCIDVHGSTSTAIVKKLVHVSSNNIKYDINENIIHEIHTSFLNQISPYITKLNCSINKTKSHDITCINDGNMCKLIQQIYPDTYDCDNIKEYELELNTILKDVKTDKTAVTDSIYKNIIASSLTIITDEVKLLLQDYKDRANENYGNGTSIKSRQLITELYTEGINNLCMILDTKLINSFNIHLDDEQYYINYNIEMVMTSFKQRYIKQHIDLSNCLEKFNELNLAYLSIE